MTLYIHKGGGTYLNPSEISNKKGVSPDKDN